MPTTLRATKQRPRRQLALNGRPPIGVPRIYGYPVPGALLAVRCPFCDGVHLHAPADVRERLAICSPADSYQIVPCDPQTIPDSLKRAAP